MGEYLIHYKEQSIKDLTPLYISCDKVIFVKHACADSGGVVWEAACDDNAIDAVSGTAIADPDSQPRHLAGDATRRGRARSNLDSFSSTPVFDYVVRGGPHRCRNQSSSDLKSFLCSQLAVLARARGIHVP